MSAMVARVSKSVTQTPLGELVEDFKANRIEIPPHQREYCWPRVREQQFILSILQGFPIPSILMSKRSGATLPTIEDGRQRLTAATHFFDGKFAIEWGTNDSTYYVDLSADDKRIFLGEIIIVQTFRNADDEARIRIFDWSQNGAPLSVGERLHAQFATPLVSLVKEVLMTRDDPDNQMPPGTLLHDRASHSWGVRGDPLIPEPGVPSKDKRRNWLRNATALISGLVHGPNWATKKYEPGLIVKQISDETKAAVRADLVRILEIYERAAEIEPPTKRNGSPNKHFDLGTYTGCILFSLSSKARSLHDREQEELYPGEDVKDKRISYDDVYVPNSLDGDEEEWEMIKSTWVDYIVEVRTRLNEYPSKTFKSVLEEKIHKDASKARSWTTDRWENGFKRVFGLVVDEDIVEAEEEEEDESSTASSDDEGWV